MKVFKYLVALADISVGFLGLFFVIFTVTRPSLPNATLEKENLERIVQQLRQDIRQLEEIKLAKARSAGKALAGKEAAKIIITGQSVVVERAGRQTRFATLDDFSAGTQNWPWPASVVLYVDITAWLSSGSSASSTPSNKAAAKFPCKSPLWPNKGETENDTRYTCNVLGLKIFCLT
jgi:hypothetical protein